MIGRLAPGILVAAIIALASQFVSEHYGAPAMLLALLFGIALNFLSSEPRSAAGIAFASRTLLRIGVALLDVVSRVPPQAATKTIMAARDEYLRGLGGELEYAEEQRRPARRKRRV